MERYDINIQTYYYYCVCFQLASYSVTIKSSVCWSVDSLHTMKDTDRLAFLENTLELLLIKLVILYNFEIFGCPCGYIISTRKFSP